MYQYLKIILFVFVFGSLHAADPTKVKIPSKNKFSWSVSADYVALFQGDTSQSSNPIVSVTDGTSTTPYETMLTAGDLTKSFVSGLQALISVNTDPLLTLDLHFLGWANWRETASAHSEASTLVTNWYNIDSYYDWSQAANVSSKYHQELDCLDVGIWFHSAPRGKDYFRLSGFAGPRYLLYRDTLKMTSQRSDDISNSYMSCRNNYAGALLGLEFEASPLKWFSWSIKTLGGLYADFVHKNNTLYDYNNSIIDFNYDLSTTDIAYSIEVSPMFSIRAGRYLDFHMSYLVMYITNIAISALQISPDINNASIWMKSSFLFQAGTIGLGCSF